MKLLRVGIRRFLPRGRAVKISSIASAAMFFGALLTTMQAQQQEAPIPESPDWNAEGPAVVPEVEGPPPLFPPVETLPPAPIDPLPAALAVGVPQGNWHLPDLSANDSWFALDGLRARIGPVQLRFDLGINFGYNDNIFNFNSPKVGDYITTISPTLQAGLGDFPRRHVLLPLDEKTNYAFLRYTPQPQFFATNTDQNTVNENLLLEGRYSFSRLILEGSFTYTKDANPTAADFGRQEYYNYGLNIDANYALSPKTFFQLRINGFHQDYSQGLSYTTVSVAPALGYLVGEKLQLTFGPVAGITYIEGGGEQPFEGIQLGFRYSTLRKLSFSGSIGVQATQLRGIEATGDTDFVNPTYALGVSYLLSATSQVDLNLAQSVSNSGTGNGQAYVNTVTTLNFRKTFFQQRVEVDLNGTYQRLAYQGNPANERTDDYIYFNAKLGYRLWQERCYVYLQYTRSQRFSEFEYLQFDANFFGTGIDVQF